MESKLFSCPGWDYVPSSICLIISFGIICNCIILLFLGKANNGFCFTLFLFFLRTGTRLDMIASGERKLQRSIQLYKRSSGLLFRPVSSAIFTPTLFDDDKSCCVFADLRRLSDSPCSAAAHSWHNYVYFPILLPASFRSRVAGRSTRTSGTC